ncbi:MAG: fibronectin type III domain-containing protein [Clostridia bacterium]|nr:fibronectin type III domain-containing protein [Clostridia bacterium]
MKKVLAAIVTFIFSMCLLSATVATASAASVKKVSSFKASATPVAVTLTWKKTSGAKGYEIQQKSGKKWKTVTNIKKQKTTSYTVKKLKNGTTYQFRIRAVNGKKKGAYVTVKVKTGVQKIANVKAVSTALTTAKVTWDKANVTGYELQYSTSKKFTKKTTKTVKIKKAKTTSYTVKKLTAGKKTYFRVRGYVNGSAKTYYGSYTTVNATTAVTAMSNVNVKSVTDSSVTVGWSKISGVGGYQVQKLQSGKWVDVSTSVKSSVAQYTVNGLSAFADQQIRIRAYQKSGSKTFYNNWVTVKAKTNMGKVSGVSVSNLTASSAKISWKAAGGAAGYRVLNGSTKLADVKATSATVSLKAASSYKITVVPYNGSVTGTASSAVSFTSPCAKVTGLNTGSITDSAVSLSWTAVSGAKSYQIQYSKDGKNWLSATSSAASTTIRNLDANTSYTFKVSAVNQNGGKNQNGEYSAAVTVKTLIGVPSGLKVTALSDTSATVSWNAARGAKAYRVFRNNSSVAETTATSVTLTLAPATTYKVSVMGYDGDVNGALSDNIEFTTTPSKITGVTAEKTADKAFIKWAAADGAAGYEIQYRKATASEWLPCGFTEDTEFFAENLTKGTAYVFRVCAYNYNGDKRQTGAFSDTTASVTVSEFFTKIDDTNDILEWNAIDGADAYKVEYYVYDSDKWMEDSYGSATSARVQSNNSIDTFKVVAYDEDQNVIYTSKSVNFTKSGYTLTQDGSKLTVSWPASASKYKVTRSTDKNYKDTQEITATTATYYLAPGLMHRFEIYTDNGTKVAKFAVDIPELNLTDTSDTAVNSQLAYLAEGINRSKYDYSHKTVINTSSEMNSDISYMKFGMPGFEDGLLFDSSVTSLFKLVFSDMLKGTNHKIADGYIECYDKGAVSALFGIMGETGGDSNATNIKEEAVATFDHQIRGTVRNLNTGKYSNIDLDEAIQPANGNGDAYIYNLINTTAWKNGFESVKTTRTFEGYKIVAVLKAEESDTEKGKIAQYHNGLVNTVNGSNVDLGMEGGESTLKANMGKTTITAVVDDECRLVSYDVDMPYSMDMNVITTLNLSDVSDSGGLGEIFGNSSSIKLEIGVKMSGNQKSSSVFTRTK